jgi:2-polyprenyl-3-methyl-5-hydroxy-6-metoxy-1,4-benzoquinol methylase
MTEAVVQSTRTDDYLLGHDAVELDRLEQQATILAPATRALLSMAGIGPGMRVLDLGTGPGDVALLAAELVGPQGTVVGLDRAPDALATARRRAAARGATNVTFTEGDVRCYNAAEPFDAVVGRLVLLYAAEPAAVVRHHAAQVRPKGLVLAIEYDMPVARTVPACPTAATAARWVIEAFERAGLDPALGARLHAVLRGAGLHDITILGLQPYLAPEPGAKMLSGIVRTLLPLIEQTGIATAAEVDMPTLEHRLTTEISRHGAVMAPPTLVGAWATVN